MAALEPNDRAWIQKQFEAIENPGLNSEKPNMMLLRFKTRQMRKQTILTITQHDIFLSLKYIR